MQNMSLHQPSAIARSLGTGNSQVVTINILRA